jgi:hypothetical protein
VSADGRGSHRRPPRSSVQREAEGHTTRARSRTISANALAALHLPPRGCACGGPSGGGEVNAPRGCSAGMAPLPRSPPVPLRRNLSDGGAQRTGWAVRRDHRGHCDDVPAHCPDAPVIPCGRRRKFDVGDIVGVIVAAAGHGDRLHRPATRAGRRIVRLAAAHALQGCTRAVQMQRADARTSLLARQSRSSMT